MKTRNMRLCASLLGCLSLIFGLDMSTYGMTGRDKLILSTLTTEISKKPTGRLHAQRAAIYQNDKQYKQSLADIDAAIKLEPKNSVYHEIRLDLLQVQNRTNDVINELGTLIKLQKRGDKKYIALLDQRAELYRRQRNYKKTDADYDELEKLTHRKFKRPWRIPPKPKVPPGMKLGPNGKLVPIAKPGSGPAAGAAPHGAPATPPSRP